MDSEADERTVGNKVGVLLCIFAKESLLPSIRDVVAETAAVGALGVMANKCGVSCSLRVLDTTLCFVCAHLAAKREDVLGRNADFHDILAKTAFAAPSSSSADDGIAVAAASSTSSILDHDLVLWIGDLNYRIDVGVSTEEVFQKVVAGDLKFLLERDQLNIERAKGSAFKGFEEGAIAFPPTYKYQQGTDTYERRKEKKLRAPAWCDRILWRCNVSPEDVKLLEYGRCMLNPSDHKPVTATMSVTVRRVDVELEAAVRRDVVRSLDKLESGTAPHVTLSWTTKRAPLVAQSVPGLAPRLVTIGTVSTDDSDSDLSLGVGGGVDEAVPLESEGESSERFHDLESEGLGESSADVGLVRFQERKEVLIRLLNTGKVPAKFFMVPRADADETGVGAAWLSVEPRMGLVMPSEVFEIVVTIAADVGTVRKCRELTQMQTQVQVKGTGTACQLEEVLILRIDKGRDFFIPVSAQLLLPAEDDAYFNQACSGLAGDAAAPEESSSRTRSGSQFACSPTPTSQSQSQSLKFVSPLEADEPPAPPQDDAGVGSLLKLKGALSTIREKAAPLMEHARDNTKEALDKARDNTREALDKARDNTKEALDKARDNTREALDRARGKEREMRASAAEKLKPVAEKASAGWQSFTSAVSKIIPPVPTPASGAGSRAAPASAFASPAPAPSVVPRTVPPNVTDNFDAGDDDGSEDEAHV